MRLCCSLLLLPLFAHADGLEPGDLEAFEAARRRVRAPDAAAVVNPAIDRLVASRDGRAVRPLGILMIETFAHQTDLRAEIKRIRDVGAKAYEEIERLDSELAFLERKRKAGDSSVLPEIRKREDARRRQDERFKKAEADSEQLVRTAVFLGEVRERIADGLVAVLAAQEGGERTAAVAGLREVCDVAEEQQALLLVRILRGTGLPEAVPHVVEILDHPRVTSPVRRAAVLALGHLGGRPAASALTRAADREELARVVRHALGLIAGRHFETLVEARAWAKSAAAG